MTDDARTDADLLALAILRAGSITALSQVAGMPDRVTLWRWQRAGAISNDSRRALLLAYLDRSEAA